MSKERVYDERIYPLMSQIIDICKEHEISMLADFELDKDSENVPLKCTTFLLKEDAQDRMKLAAKVLSPKQSSFAMTITRGDV